MKIDAHQHFWNPARGDYGWMPEDNKILYRSYLQNDFCLLYTSPSPRDRG